MKYGTCPGAFNQFHPRTTIDIELLGRHVGGKHRLLCADDTSERACWTSRPECGTQLGCGPFGGCAIDPNPAECAVFIKEHIAKLSSANTSRLLQHGLEHWLKFSRRT